jgi:L-lactate dehydrogenase complex protein LldE
LLDSLDQVKVVEQARIEECCGFGGTFALLYPDISEAIVTDKVAAIKGAVVPNVWSVPIAAACSTSPAARAKQDELAGIKSPTLPGEHLASFLWNRTNSRQKRPGATT